MFLTNCTTAVFYMSNRKPSSYMYMSVHKL